MTAVPEPARESREVFRKHHPGLLQSDEQVIGQFAVRQPELEIVLDILRGNLDSPSCQHALILGPRGQGKSTLLARVAAEIRTNPEFAPRLLPVRFTDESAEVFDAASFWLETLFHVAREVEASQPEIAAELRATRADVIRRWQDAPLEESARAAVLAASERMDRRLVLMVENLHVLFGRRKEDFGWKLRASLQSEPRIILLATATARFAAIDDARAPFFELFHTVSLDSLHTEDCRRLWERVSGESLEGRDIRPLEILTGGSPRLLVILGQSAERLSLRGLMERLAALIDDHSEYFRTQIEALPALERRVFLAMADLWQPSEAGEIAARARLDIRTVSVMLGRLRKRGAVIARPERKKQLHAIAERLFCIYYKLRREQNEAGVIRHLIRFMGLFYSSTGRLGWFLRLLDEARTTPEVREGLLAARTEHPLVFRALEQETRGRLTVALKMLSDAVDSLPEVEPSERTRLHAVLMVETGRMQLRLDDAESAIATYEEATSRLPARTVSDLAVAITRHLSDRAFAEAERNDFGASRKTCELAMKRFGANETPEVQAYLVVALMCHVTLEITMGPLAAALARCDEMAARVDRVPEALRPGLQWLAHSFRAQALAEHGRTDAAVAEFRSAYEVFLPANDMMLGDIQNLVPDLVAAGASPQELVEVLASDRAKAEALSPLVAALRLQTGETVRVPAEVLDVAKDVGEAIREQVDGAPHPQRG